MSVVADPAPEPDPDVVALKGDPVDAVVEQSIEEGAPRVRAAWQVLVAEYPGPLRVLIRHVTIVLASVVGLARIRLRAAGRAPAGRPQFSSP